MIARGEALAAFEGDRFDLVVIGGGITGADSSPARPVKTTRLITRGLVSANRSRQSAITDWGLVNGRLVTGAAYKRLRRWRKGPSAVQAGRARLCR